MRSIGDRRYTAAAASAIFAARGSTGSVARRVMSRTTSGSARSRAFTGAPRARTRCGCALLQTFGDQLAHVLDGQPLLRAGDLAAEIEHGQAEGARGGHGGGAGGQQLLGADDVHPLFRFDLHPHVTAATATAEPALAGVRRV